MPDSNETEMPGTPDTMPAPKFTTIADEGLPSIEAPANVITDFHAPAATPMLKGEKKVELAGPAGVVVVAEKDVAEYLTKGYRRFKRG